jgi:hypothetical protein
MDKMLPAGAFAAVMAERPRGRRPIPAPEIALLADVPLFDGLSKRQLKRVAEAADEVIYREGAIVFLQGDRAAVESVIDFMRNGPPGAVVTDCVVSWRPAGERHHGFDIRY